MTEEKKQLEQAIEFGKNPYVDNPEWWTNSSNLIGIHIWIYRIRKVDVLNESFSADIRMALSWQGGEQDFIRFKQWNQESHTAKELYQHQYDAYTDIIFKNALVESETLIDSGVLHVGAIGTNGQKIENSLWKYENYVVYKLECEMFEKYELQNFPFDCQDLQITMQLKKRKNVQNFCPFTGLFDFPNGLDVGSSNLTEYNVKNMLSEIYDVNFDGQLAVYSFMNFRVKIQRKFGVYLSKIIFLMFLTTLGAFLVFTMGEDSLADQYGLLVTLLLAAVAVQFVVGTYVPNLPYLTYLDYYVLLSFVMVFIVGLVVSLMNMFEVNNDIESMFAIILLVVFFIIQIVFIIWAIYARKYENKKLDFDRWDYTNFGYDNDDYPIMSQAKGGCDQYTADRMKEYEWGKNMNDKNMFIKSFNK